MKSKVETWYEIEELIPPNEALANMPHWTSVVIDGKRFVETSLERAKMTFDAAPPGRFRLVRLTRQMST